MKLKIFSLLLLSATIVEGAPSLGSGTSIGPSPLNATTAPTQINGATNINFVAPFVLRMGGTNLFSVGTNLNNNTSELISRAYTNADKFLTDFFDPNSEPVGANVSSYTPLVGGNIAGTTGIPPQGGGLWRKEPMPPVLWTTFWLGWGTNINSFPTEQLVTNYVQYWKTNGVFAALTNYTGVRFYISIDTGWHATNSDTTSLQTRYPRDVNGDLQWNTGLFPTLNGTNLMKYILTNGFYTQLHQYFDTATPQTVEASSNANMIIQCATTPHTVQQDIKKMYEWGVSCLRVGDMNGAYNPTVGYQRQISLMVNDAVSHPTSFPWAYRFFGSNAMSIASFQTVSQDPRDSSPYEMNTQQDDQGNLPDGTGRDTARAMYQVRWTYTNMVWAAGKGHYFSSVYPSDVFGTLEDCRSYFAMGAMFPAQWNLGNVASPIDPGAITIMTNRSMLNIYFDKWCLPAFKIFDYGSNTVSAWAKPLSDPEGGFAIALSNQGASSSNITINAGMIKSPGNWMPIGLNGQQFSMLTNQLYDGWDIWTNSYVASMSDQLNFTLAVPANSIRWIRFNPRPVWTPGSAGTIYHTTNEVQIHGSGSVLKLWNRDADGSYGLGMYGNANVFHFYDIATGLDFMSWTNNGAVNNVLYNYGVIGTTHLGIRTNALTGWPATPLAANVGQGGSAIVSSNGYPYILLSTNGAGGSVTWTGTNKLGW